MSILDDILSVANPAPRLKEPTDFDEFGKSHGSKFSIVPTVLYAFKSLFCREI